MGESATLILLGRRYDGGHKAWVRWPDGADDIVPGSAAPGGTVASSRSRPGGEGQDPHLPRGPDGEDRWPGRGTGDPPGGDARGERGSLPRGQQAALERRHIEAAEQIVAALGTMKGAAMKVGQVLSFLDVGMVPEEYREEFQHKLAALRDAAPTVTFKDMRKVIEEELGERLSDVFEEFDQEPIAAASIGQVYRARCSTAGEVAVKVQYPGVAAAVRADMQNLGLILRLAKRIAPGMDPKAIGEEIRFADPGGARLRARGPEPAHARADLPRPPVHRHPGRDHLAVAGADDGLRVRPRDRLRGAQDVFAGATATGSARCCSASISAACTATVSSRATRIPATRSCSTTNQWRSMTSGCSSGCRRERSSSRSTWRAR